MASEGGSIAADLALYVMALDAAARAQDEGGVSKYLAIAEGAAADADHDLYKAVVRRARGVGHRLAGEWDQAADQLAAAVEEFRLLDAPWQIGRTLLELGEVEQSLGHTGLAREHYSEALGAFESLGAAPDAERTRAALELLS